MADQNERFARLLVRALYRATDGKARLWVLPAQLNEVTQEAIAVAVARGWMVYRGDSVCLTEEGRGLVGTYNRLGLAALKTHGPAKH